MIRIIKYLISGWSMIVLGSEVIVDYYKGMQEAIDYIEVHLQEEITLSDISDVTGYSIPHIYRLFGAIVGLSVMSYVRKRRLSCALYDIVTTNRQILDIALDYGYESHEAFTRVFKLAYGSAPRTVRKSSNEPILFERMNLLSEHMTKGDDMYKPEIICKDAITLIGLSKFVSGPEKQKYEILIATRDEMKEKSHLVTNRLNDDLYYAAYDYVPEDLDKEDDDITYTYYYCVEAGEESNVPEGMVKKEIPQGKFAVFNYDLNNNTLNGMTLEEDVYDYIDGVWLPSSGFELSDTSDYEIINKSKNQIEYYISIK